MSSNETGRPSSSRLTYSRERLTFPCRNLATTACTVPSTSTAREAASEKAPRLAKIMGRDQKRQDWVRDIVAPHCSAVLGAGWCRSASEWRPTHVVTWRTCICSLRAAENVRACVSAQAGDLHCLAADGHVGVAAVGRGGPSANFRLRGHRLHR